MVDLVLAVLGVALLLLVVVDALWTTLWVDGAAGPLTDRVTSWTWRATLAVVGRRRHRALTGFGPIVLVSTVVLWILLLVAGWTLLFGSEPGSLRDSSDDELPGWTGRIWFVAYTMFTVGNGDFTPQDGVWQVVSSVVGFSGLFLVTLAITYLLSVLSAVVSKRSFAAQVDSLGSTPEEFVLTAWDGRDLRGLDLQLASLSSQLSQLTEQYLSYPVLQYYHAARAEKSPVKALAVLDDALSLIRFGVDPSARPGGAALNSMRSSVQSFLDTAGTAALSPAEQAPPPPDLSRLRAAGVPTVSDEQFAQALSELDERRRTLLGFVRGDGWKWS